MHHTEAVRMACEGGHLCQCRAWVSVVWYACSEAAAIHEKAGQKHKEFAQGLTATDDRLKFSPRSVWPQRCTLPPFIPSCPLRPSVCLPGAMSISDKLKLQSHPGPPFSSHLGTPKRGCLGCIHNCPSEVYKVTIFQKYFSSSQKISGKTQEFVWVKAWTDAQLEATKCHISFAWKAREPSGPQPWLTSEPLGKLQGDTLSGVHPRLTDSLRGAQHRQLLEAH